MSTSMRSESRSQPRREVEELVCGVPGGRSGELSFEEPWEIRAFALAVSAHQAGQFEWATFQSALIESIKHWEEETGDLADGSWSYYEHWVVALEKVLADLRAVEPEALRERTHEVLTTPPDRHHQQAHLEPVAVDAAKRP